MVIIKELNIDKRIAELCKNSHWELASKTVESNNWERKIACYSDMRVGPFGIVGLHERFNDLFKRRPHSTLKLKVLQVQGTKLEKQIQEILDIDLGSVDDLSIDEQVKDLRQIKIY